jgi:histidyl-tRNA synthetase
LRDALAPYAARMSEDSKRRLEQNPLRVLDTKDESDLAVLRELGAKLPRMLDVVDAEDRAHWDEVVAGLESAGSPTSWTTGSCAGSTTTRAPRSRCTILAGCAERAGGGGRYDGLIEQLGGNPTPGVGFAIGMDRALLVMEERGLALEAADRVCVVAMDATRAGATALVRELRKRFAVESDVEARGFGAQMKSAGKSGARFLVIAGEEEWARGEVALKDSKTGEQQAVKREALADEIAARSR